MLPACAGLARRSDLTISLVDLTANSANLTLQSMATLQEVLSHFGGTVKLAGILGITPQAVSSWKSIPLLRAYQIAELGHFKLSDLPVKRKV